MPYRKIILFSCLFMTISWANAQQAITKQSFSMLNLSYPGFEKVNAEVKAGRYNKAAEALLKYYRQKLGKTGPDFSNAEQEVDLEKPLAKNVVAAADSALLHRFQPHKGYGFFYYGKDINWQLWPVKDNEVRWQLHRVKWWQSMALVYHNQKNESFTREWMMQFADWAKKNPLGLSKENDHYAWRPLEVSDRVQSLVPTFSIFVQSPAITPSFLLAFLKSYEQQAHYLSQNFADEGNHRLFEAQRTLFAGTSFPEFNNAPAWRKTGIDVLNAEIKKQVYPDGMQYELSPVYHAAAIDIFLKAYRSVKSAGLENELPNSYQQTVESMIMAYINFIFPDYQSPMFGDSWLGEKAAKKRQFVAWSSIFTNNETIRYFATEGKQGKHPAYLSHGLTIGGFYTFRNGWNEKAMVMVLKASPPGKFHAQPDNGTFELWVKGRNFTPDAGCFVYSGDEEIMKMREWYRQSRVHSTLTLNNENMVITQANLHKWDTSRPLDILTYSNPSYANLQHKRSVLFVDKTYFIVIDQAIGNATGLTGVHFQLKEDSKPVFNAYNHSIHTTYADGNNLLIQNFGNGVISAKEEEGKVSYKYREELNRPAFVFEKNKDLGPAHFITVVYPFDDEKAPAIKLSENPDNDFAAGKLSLTITINGISQKIETRLE